MTFIPSESSLKIAVDFDGTIVDHEYPKIGKVKMFAFETLKALQDKGHRLILWTYRSGKDLDEAVAYCKENGIIFYAINESYEGEVYDSKEISRKVDADIFIDDRNVGGFLGWDKIYQLIEGNEKLLFASDLEDEDEEKPQKGFLSRIFG